MHGRLTGHHPCWSHRDSVGQKSYVTPAFSGAPKQGGKIRSGCLTLAFSGAHRRAEVLRKSNATYAFFFIKKRELRFFCYMTYTFFDMRPTAKKE